MRRGRETVASTGPRALLVCNLVLALLAFAAVWRFEEERGRDRFEQLVDRTHAAISTDVELILALLRGVVGLFEASRSVEAAEFHAYVAALDVRRTNPGLLGLGYAQRVGPGDVEALEATLREQGRRDFRIWPRPTSDDDAAIVFLEPSDRGNLRALGYTMTREATRRAAMERTRDTGRPVASSVVTLIQESEPGLPGILVFLPHYAPGAPLQDEAARRAALRGYVYSPVRVRELFAAGRQIPDELAVRVYEGTSPRPTSLLYESPSPPEDTVASADRVLDVFGQTWTVRYLARAPTPVGVHAPAVLVLAAGLLFSGLVYRLQALQVAARVRAERDAAALRDGEQRYRFLADAMPHVVFTADAAGSLAYANRRWEDAQPGTPLARGLAIHREDRPLVETSWAHAVATGAEWSASFRLWSPHERAWRWCLGRALPQRSDGTTRAWVGTLTDIEAQKQAERALQVEAEELERRVQARTAELERSVRELENFAAVASHDLQEPLRKIVSFGDRLADALGPDLPPAASDALARMRRSAQRLQQLISDLLTFTRISRAEVMAIPVDLTRLAAEVRDELLEGRSDGAVVHIEPIPVACGDPGLLRQLLVNLLENALKFHPPDEPPRVRISAEPAGDEVAAEDRDGWFRLLVEDEGIGFDPKYLQRIFQVFQRLHPPGRYAGTGVGLAICQRVVELHGGRITARSSPSAGACFVSTLPRARRATTEGGCPT